MKNLSPSDGGLQLDFELENIVKNYFAFESTHVNEPRNEINSQEEEEN